MHDRPTASELLMIVAETLSDTVVPATEPHARHQARVAANLCRVVARELGQTVDSASLLSALEDDLGIAAAGSPSERLAQIASAISAPTAFDTAAFDTEAVHGDVVALVQSKLDVVKPGYHLHDADAEADVVA